MLTFWNSKEAELGQKDGKKFQFCESGSQVLIFIHPGSRIQQQQKKRRGKNFVVVLTLNCSHKFRKTINLFLNRYRKKFEPIHEEL
jgi:hypothetical protein